jgi:hypothetical protein
LSDPSSPYVMTISRTTVDKLGIKLYDKASAVVGELIANAYDGDAENVTVKIPLNRWLSTKSEGQVVDQGLEILVEDDGHGIEPKRVNEFYLTVGKNPRDDPDRGPVSFEKKRPIFGRKGIGKLAPFGICTIIEVRFAGGKKTVQGYRVAHFIMNYDEINTETDKPYHPKVGKDDGKFSSERGTVVTLRNFLYRRTPDEETFRRQLARLFGLQLPDFKIEIVNTETGNRFAIGQLDVEIEDETKIVVDDRPVKMPDGSELPVRGYVAYAKRPYRFEEVAGVRIYARGKLVSSTRDFGLRAGFTGEHTLRSYLTGELYADWLDEEEDLIHTGRQDILWDSERGEPFKAWGQELLRELGKKAWTPMKQKAYKVFLENSNLETKVEERFGKTPVADTAMTLGKAIGQIASIESLQDPEYVERLTEIVLTTAPHKMLVDKLAEIAETEVESPLDVIVALFNDARLAEAASMGQIAVERVDAIDKLEEKIGAQTPEYERELQKLLERAPWLMHPEWTVLQANRPFEELRSAFEKWYENKYKRKIVTKSIDSLERPDFILLAVSATVEIVEIKKAEHALTDEEFSRLRGYYDAIEQFMKDNQDFRAEFPRTHVTLICDKVNLSRDIQLAFEKLQGDSVLTRKTWWETLAKTKKVHEQFLEQHRRPLG